jgi:putative redox protein
MSRERIVFPNGRGQDLAAALEMPSIPVVAYALFAHCFTCGKDSAAAARISRGLAARGIAVLRFDFTGLGGSEGDFGNTGFATNVDDLVAAADYLRSRGAAPTLLVGHSLGGTAVLFAARRIPEVAAVVTIGAPASAEHVVRRLGVDLTALDENHAATATLAGRKFQIGMSFLDDLEAEDLSVVIGRWKRALLVMHAPFDEVVSIDEASKIFLAARHPKSYLSLDGADHLLTKLDRAQYVAATIAAWVEPYLPDSEAEDRVPVEAGSVWVEQGDGRFLCDLHSDDHHWLADEPKRLGGDNLGPDPYEHLLAALGACTSMTLRMYAERKRWPLESVSVQLTHAREYLDDCEGCESEDDRRLEKLTRVVSLAGELTSEQRDRLLEIADRCPVHRTLTGRLRVETTPH